MLANRGKAEYARLLVSLPMACQLEDLVESESSTFVSRYPPTEGLPPGPAGHGESNTIMGMPLTPGPGLYDRAVLEANCAPTSPSTSIRLPKVKCCRSMPVARIHRDLPKIRSMPVAQAAMP